MDGVIGVTAHILWSGDLWGYCLVGDGHWSDGRTGLGFGGGLTLVTLGSLAAGVVGVLFVGTIPWQVIVLWASVSALVLSSTSIQTFTCQLAAILPSVILMVDFAFVHTCSTSAVDESVERVVGPDVGLASEAWVLDWVGIKDWAGVVLPVNPGGMVGAMLQSGTTQHGSFLSATNRQVSGIWLNSGHLDLQL